MQKPIQEVINYLKKDSWDSWFVCLILIVVGIKLLFFPALSALTNTQLPIVIVESCSMYHGDNFNSWWEKNPNLYSEYQINKTDFSNFNFRNGINKGDIIFLWGRGEYKKGDTIIFNAETAHPIIHRIISKEVISTKGDNNDKQISFEKNIKLDSIIGKAVFRIPYAGWIKLIFFEPLRPENERGLCKARDS